MGVTQVQGCVNGYGERTGNADLTAAVPDLTLKMGVRTIGAERLGRLTAVSHHIAEVVNVAPDPHQPFVGVSAFAHKAGLHTSAIARSRDAYEHVDPEEVGNGTRFVVSEMAGRSTVALKAEQLGLGLDDADARRHRRAAQGPGAPGLPLRGGRRFPGAADALGQRGGSSPSSRSNRTG